MRIEMRLLNILLVALLSVPALALQAGVVQLRVGFRYCSGTVVKAENGKCHLLTAAHCAIDTPIYGVTSHGTGSWGQWIAGAPPGAVNQSLPIRRADLDRDLAELEWHQSLNPLCAQLTHFKMRTAVDLAPQTDSVALFGAMGGTVHAMTVDDAPWPKIVKPSVRSIYSLGGIDDLLIENVRGVRGFSGGPVIDFNGNLLGIYKRFIPRDDVILVSPTQQIQEFLNQLNPPRNLKLCPQTFGRYSFGSGNSHANGGGNSHGNGGGDLRGTNVTPELLAQWITFREPSEGILNPQNCANVILAKGESSIDGPEDYEKLLRAPGAWIERPADGLPSEKIRRGILDRFVGTYVSKARAKQNNYIFKEGYVELAQGVHQSQHIRLEVKKRGNNDYSIRLEQTQTEFYSYQYPNLNQRRADGATEIFARLSPNAETVEVTQQLNSYSCVNDNYLKLICEGNGVLFSISKPSLSGPKLKLRYTRGVYARLRGGDEFRVFMHMIDELEKVP